MAAANGESVYLPPGSLVVSRATKRKKRGFLVSTHHLPGHDQELSFLGYLSQNSSKNLFPPWKESQV